MFAKVHSFLNNIVVPSAKVSLRNESFFIIPHHVFQLTLFYQQKSFSDIGSNKNKAFIVYSTYLWPSKEFENVKRLSVHKKSHVFLWKLLLQGNSSCCYASYIKHFEDKKCNTFIIIQMGLFLLCINRAFMNNTVWTVNDDMENICLFLEI